MDTKLLRDMRTEDLSDVLRLERGAQLSPWSRLSFEESLNRDHRCRVLVADGRLVGFHVICGVVDELHILNVVIGRQFQKQGLGHLLMQDIVEIAEETTASKLFLEVRASNAAAQALYRRWQFKQIAVRKAYYSASSTTNGDREDAHVFVRLAKDQAIAF